MNEITRGDVVCAVIIRAGRLLLTQRLPTASYPLMWESPGGKVEVVETPRQALARELHEELGVDAIIGEPVAAYDIDPPASTRPLRVMFFGADIGDQDPDPIGAAGSGWFSAEELGGLKMLPGNVCALTELQKHLLLDGRRS